MAKLLNTARALRRNMTRQESRLWYDYLRSYPIKIYKQRVIDNYIVDFYCHSALLVIEIDGSQHYEPDAKRYDEMRTEDLSKHGILVLRFSNCDVDRHFNEVCSFIDKTIKDRVQAAFEK